MDFFKRHKITERMMEKEREGGRESNKCKRERGSNKSTDVHN